MATTLAMLCVHDTYLWVTLITLKTITSMTQCVCILAGAAPLVATNFFGRGDGPIVGNNVMCRGDEDGIIDCMFDRNHNCGHENDVAVRCMTTDRG